MKDLAAIIRLVILEKKDILYSIIFGFIAGITTVGLFAASGYLISKAALIPPFYTLIILTSTVKLLGFAKAIARYAERYFSHRATFTILSHIRVTFFEKIEPLVPRIFQKFRSGDLLSRIVGDVETLQNFFLRVFYPPIVLALVFLGTIIFTAFFSVHTAILLLIGLLLTVFVIPAIFGLKQAKIASNVREKRSSLSTETTEFLYGFRDLKIYQQLANKQKQLMQTSDRYIQAEKHDNIHNLYNQSLNSFVSLIITWSILAAGAYLVSDGQLDGIFLAMLVLISLTVFEDAAPMAAFPIHYQDSKRAIKRLTEVVGYPGEIRQDENETITLQSHQPEHIEINNLTFTFPYENRPALKDITLSLPQGSKTAIVGPSGSGKSTLLQLLLKLFAVDPDNIIIDSKDIDHIKSESLWKQTNVILQENHFFYGTIRSNLQLAGDDLTDEAMQNSLTKVELDYFSLDDPVAEKGDNLSGGEKERLAIARILMNDAPLWLLDEPTSSIDAVTEENIYKNLFKQAENNILVLVSHRLTNLESMDQIIVMDQGTIIESGTYEQLIAKKGYLYNMKQIEKDLL